MKAPRMTSTIWRWIPKSGEQDTSPPSPKAIADRDRRLAYGETRSLTGQLMGDPPAGRSALEKKIEAEIRRSMMLTQPPTDEVDDETGE